MIIFPVNDHVVVQIEEEHVPTFIPIKEQQQVVQIQQHVFQIQQPIVQIQRPVVVKHFTCCLPLNAIIWIIIIISISAVTIAMIACGHGFCGNEKNYPPPPK